MGDINQLMSRINDLEVKSIKDFCEFVKHGAKTIDIKVRVDGKNYTFEGDYLKYVLPFVNEIINKEAS